MTTDLEQIAAEIIRAQVRIEKDRDKLVALYRRRSAILDSELSKESPDVPDELWRAHWAYWGGG